jgi:plastocyanin
MKRTIFRLPGAIAALGGLVLAGCSQQASAPAAGPKETQSQMAVDVVEAAGKTEQVAIDNFTYSPAVLTVAAGTKVTWVNRDDVPHTVTSPAKPRVLDSGTLDTDQSFSHVFSNPGTYEYFCAVHPKMTGKIIVK